VAKTGTQLDTSQFKKRLNSLLQSWSAREVCGAAKMLADQMLKFAIDSPIPRGRYAAGGGLAGSGTIDSDDKTWVKFGFNRVYAAFQDAPGLAGSYVLIPKKKRMLYIPLSDLGRKHVYGANPRLEGLVWGKDYVLTKRVTMAIKGYRSMKGPNHYFSETLRQRSAWFLHELGNTLKVMAKASLTGGG
jgi:hypothetical protein